MVFEISTVSTDDFRDSLPDFVEVGVVGAGVLGDELAVAELVLAQLLGQANVARRQEEGAQASDLESI
jgi:hypothetical protein